MVKTPIFKGSCTAIVTPFNEHGVDYDRLQKNIDYQYENGTAAIVVCGTTGEAATQSQCEQNETVRQAIKFNQGRMKLIVGVGSNNTETALRNAENAKTAGADGILMVTPYYNKCSQDGLVKHFFAVADAVDLPIIVYNVPGRTGVNVAPATLARLAEHPNIQAIKEASGNISQIAEMARLIKGKMDLYSGNDDQIVPILSLGGKGVISVLANVAPKAAHDICASYLSGDVKTACDLQLHYNPLNAALFSDVNPIPVKTALNLMGFEAGPLRLPLSEMSAQGKDALRSVLQSYDLI